MPRYASNNLAALDNDYRKAHNIGAGNSDPKKNRYAYGRRNNILVAQGRELFEQGFTIRLLPIYEAGSKGNRTFANFREGRNNEAYGDWSRLFVCANWVGNPGVCFIIHDGNDQTSPYDSPYHVLRKVAWDNKDTPGIGRLFSELISKNFVAKSHIGSLRKPENTLFVSASEVVVDDYGQPKLLAFGDDKKKNSRIIGLKTSAASSLLAALAMRDEATGEHLVGDMLSFDAAPLVTFLPETFGRDKGFKNSPAISPQGPTGVPVPKYAQQKSSVFVGYPPSRSDMTHFCVIHDAYNGKPVDLGQYAERITAETETWDDYMFFPTFEEQAEMLAPAFPREALAFAWRDRPEYLRALPRGTTTVEVGDRDVEELEEEDVAPRQQQQPQASRPRPSSQPAQAPAPTPPWEGSPEVELSADESANLDNMFAAGEPAQPTPPRAAQQAQPTQRPSTNVADIVARARANVQQRKS